MAELTCRRLILSLCASLGDRQRLAGFCSTCYAGKVDTWGLGGTLWRCATFINVHYKYSMGWSVSYRSSVLDSAAREGKRPHSQRCPPLFPFSSVKVAPDILCPLNICFHCCFIAYWNMYRGWDIFMANIWSTSSPKIYAFQDIGEKHSIMRLGGPH